MAPSRAGIALKMISSPAFAHSLAYAHPYPQAYQDPQALGDG